MRTSSLVHPHPVPMLLLQSFVRTCMYVHAAAGVASHSRHSCVSRSAVLSLTRNRINSALAFSLLTRVNFQPRISKPDIKARTTTHHQSSSGCLQSQCSCLRSVLNLQMLLRLLIQSQRLIVKQRRQLLIAQMITIRKIQLLKVLRRMTRLLKKKQQILSSTRCSRRRRQSIRSWQVLSSRICSRRRRRRRRRRKGECLVVSSFSDSYIAGMARASPLTCPQTMKSSRQFESRQTSCRTQPEASARSAASELM